ncbi:hypothetical protein MMC22_009473 [Lobaria immixta]|nr:hypothetical protein [Lobaria immixta]
MSYRDQPQNRLWPSSMPQLRHSCDACNIAKVKCSKTRPKCTRCEARNVECVYGVSLRSAKGKAASFKDARGNEFNGNRNDSSQGAFSSTPTNPSASMISHPMMPPLSETSVDASILDGWNSNFSEIDDQVSFAELGDIDDPTMILSHVYTQNSTGSGHQDQLFPDLRYKHTFTAPNSIDTHHSNNNLPSSAETCSCRQKILAKLSECWVASRDTLSAFDKALSENKIIITLCTSAVHCLDKCHTDDIILMLNIIGLINQVITIFDSPVSDNLLSSSASGVDETLRNSPSVDSSTPGSHASANQPALGVRLSLGSYQLDQQDEQILKVNLLRIELDKIGVLIELFESRFCSPREWSAINSQGGRGEPKPFNELLTHLRRRLRTNQEALRP